MEKYDVKFKKKFGQNFLKDINIVRHIVDVGEVDNNSLVIEVGPGGAVMTRELALKAKNVLAYEKAFFKSFSHCYCFYYNGFVLLTFNLFSKL